MKKNPLRLRQFPPDGRPSNYHGVEIAVNRRAWHLWGIAIFATGFLGLAILVSGGMIADSLDSYCPEVESTIYRST